MPEIVGEPNVQYTSKEFASIRDALVQDFLNRYGAVNTDFSTQNYVTAFLELIAYVGDMLAFTQDAQARECFFPTAVLRESILKHAALIGYQLPGRVAATALVRFELERESLFSTTIPAETVLTTADGNSSLRFRVLDDEVLPAGPAGTAVEFYVEHSELFSDIFTASGSASSRFLTSRTNVLLSGIQSDGNLEPNVLVITVDGIPYTIVDSFLESEPTDTHVIVTLSNSGRLIATFGNGQNGIAADGEVIIDGRYGGGSSGNNAVITQGPSLLNDNSESIIYSVFNSVVSGGGADEQSIEEARVQAPLSLQTSNRTVSRQDFITNSEGVPGVDRALPLTSNEDVSVPENQTDVIILSDSPTNSQLTGGSSASPLFAPLIVDGVNDEFFISLNRETPQLIDLGNQSSGVFTAQEIQDQVRALTPEFALDNAEAYANFTCIYDATNDRYILTNGQAGLSSSIDITLGVNDAAVDLKIDVLGLTKNTLGASPSTATIAAVLTELTINKPVCNTHAVQVLGPEIEAIYMDFSVRFEASADTQALKSQVRDIIRANLSIYFSPRLSTGVSNPEIDFGRTIRFSDLISIVNGTPGVESVDEDSFIPADDVPVPSRAFPVLGGVTVRDVNSFPTPNEPV